MRGSHCVKAWGKAQPMVTLSSAEAALVATVKGATEGRGYSNLLSDFGKSAKVKLIMDASAAIGMLERTGIGTATHVDLKWMWIQGAIRRGDIQVLKIGTHDNPADLMTKFLTAETTEKHLNTMGCWYAEGSKGKE